MEFLVPSLHNRPKDLDVSETRISTHQGSPFYNFFLTKLLNTTVISIVTRANCFSGIRTNLNEVTITSSV